MVEIIPDRPKRSSVGERLMQGVGAFSEYQQQQQQRQQQEKEYAGQNQIYSQLTGRNLSHDPKIREKEIEYALKGKEEETKGKRKLSFDKELEDLKHANQMEIEKLKSGGKSNKEEQDKFEKLKNLEGALSSIDEMKNLRKKGNLGRGSSFAGFFGGETAKDRGQYQTLGNSLIQYATNIPIRNRQEFEKLAGNLGNPNITDAEAEGILSAMESIINNSMAKYSPEDEAEPIQEAKQLDADVMKLIYEKSGGDKEKAKKIARKMGYKV